MSKAPTLPQHVPTPGRIVHYTADGYFPGEKVTHAAMVLGSSHLPGRYYLDIRPGVYPAHDARANIVDAIRLPENDDGIPYSDYPRVGHWNWPTRTPNN